MVLSLLGLIEGEVDIILRKGLTELSAMRVGSFLATPLIFPPSPTPDCLNVITRSWNRVVVGCPVYVLTQKLKFLKESLKIWNKNTFGNVHSNVKIASQKLDDIQHVLDSIGPTDVLLDQQNIAQINLDNALNMEELFWKEKSRVSWHREGHRNTAYFHKISKIKSTTKAISTLRDGNSTLIDPEEVSARIVFYFSF
ncbi:hypothetical protein L195_g051967 [Trifolium pratense]|uniref:Uncharacterized protein n=1 Tax=Trifolium pratense TaxID=57577 RepID=A0A2K3K2I0_TRIPR|nr:hypothetical protein L195_g051967 [Trifolium pratense]